MPVWETEETIKKEGLIQRDFKEDQSIIDIKPFVDAVHKKFCDLVLAENHDLKWGELSKKITSYQNKRKDASNKESTEALKSLQQEQELFRKKIVSLFDSKGKLLLSTSEKDKKGKGYTSLLQPKMFFEEWKFEHEKGEGLFVSAFNDLYSSDKEATNNALAAMSMLQENKSLTRLGPLFKNRENLYSEDAKASSIANRIVNENFPRFNSNCLALSKILETTNKAVLDALIERSECDKNLLKQIAQAEYYNKLFSQAGIDEYNKIIGRLNQALKELKDQQQIEKRITLKSLHKQIMGDSSKNWGADYLIFNTDEELLSNVDHTKALFEKKKSPMQTIARLYKDLQTINWNGVYIGKKNLFDFNKLLIQAGIETKDLHEAIRDCVDNSLGPCKEYTKKEGRSFAKKAHYSLEELFQVMTVGSKNLNRREIGGILETSLLNVLKEAEIKYKVLIDAKVKEKKSLLQDEALQEKLKTYLDELMRAKNICCLFSLEESDITEENLEVDDSFYEVYEKNAPEIKEFYKTYDAVRNYCTKKPYSTKKMPISFGNDTLMDGWSYTKEKENGSTLLKCKNSYYLAIAPKGEKSSILGEKGASTARQNGSWEKMTYYIFKDPVKMIPKCSVSKKAVKHHFENQSSNLDLAENDPEKFILPCIVTKELFDLYSNRNDNPEFKQSGSKTQKKWIEFCLSFLESYKETSSIDFTSLRKQTYNNIQDFYQDVENLSYSMSWHSVDEGVLRSEVKEGKLLLFEVSSKDFSPYAHGKKNLNTLYFLEAMKGSKNSTIKLNGKGKAFFRDASIKSPFEHKKGELIVNKTYLDTRNKESIRYSIPEDLFEELKTYAKNGRAHCKLSDDARRLLKNHPEIIKKADRTIVKDRRYAKPHYELHISLEFSFTASNKKANQKVLNSEVLKALRKEKEFNIIGIDRGERHLLYISVIDSKGNILEQKSLNVINEFDYRTKLDNIENERKQERRDWKTIKKIKDVKDGYISAVVREIVNLMFKYNAVIGLENLNYEFKQKRSRVEKSVYRQFEKALINKLNYLVLKTKTDGEPGAPGQGYQLSSPVKSFKDMVRQNGVLFYVDPSYTSHLDPTTGFSNLFRGLYYKNTEETQKFFSAMDAVSYNLEQDCFEFTFSYKKMNKKVPKYVRDCAKNLTRTWKVCSTSPKRCISEKDDNGHWISKQHDINEDIKEAFKKEHIAFENAGDLRQIIDDSNRSKAFLQELLICFKRLMQLRYSESGKQHDAIISPVFNGSSFYNSDELPEGNRIFPDNGDANGAFNIALKTLWHINTHTKEEKEGLLQLESKKDKAESWLKFYQEEYTSNASILHRK